LPPQLASDSRDKLAKMKNNTPDATFRLERILCASPYSFIAGLQLLVSVPLSKAG
jgi:hypothetical protein